MELSGGIKASLHGRYASALYDLASESNSISAVESDLSTLEQALAASSDLTALINNPQIARSAAGTAIAAVAKSLKLSAITQNFLGVLAQGRRLGALPAIISAFSSIAAAARGEVTAEVRSARALDSAQIKKLTEKLTAREGRSVSIRAIVDPEILGGLVVRIGSRQIDSSIRTRLNSLAQAMKG